MFSMRGKRARALWVAGAAWLLLAACAAQRPGPAQGPGMQNTITPEGQPGAATPTNAQPAAAPQPAATPQPAAATQSQGLGPLTPVPPWPGGAAALQVTACALPPLVAPTPAPDPGYTQEDPSTGLHMTGTATNIDPATYRLEVTGKVAHPLSLSLDELRCLPRVAARPRLVCPGFFVDNANWAGASLAAVLALAEPASDARYVELIGADGYSSLPEIGRTLDPANFLAYEWEGQPVPVLHGFPVRAVLPAEEGNRWVKWLVKINVR